MSARLGSASPRAAAAGSRLAYIDNLRWLVIVLVVLVHITVTYSGIGRWYYVEAGTLDIPSFMVFAMYGTFSQAFFMGLLFLIAGSFVPSAFDRKGFGRFVAERLLRLGGPTLIYMLVLAPAIDLIRRAFLGQGNGGGGLLRSYAGYVKSLAFLGESGPLWFAVALLIFTLLYALARLLAGPAKGRDPAPPGTHRRVVGHAWVASVIALITAASFFVRLVQPIGTAFYNMQLPFFPQYVVLFLIGLWADRAGFLKALPARFGRLWFVLSLAVGVPLWLLLMVLGGALSGNQDVYSGGWHWQAAGYALWENLVCVGFCLGLLVFYRERRNRRTPLSGFLADNAFGVYVFHPLILVSVSLALRPLLLHPLAKALLVAVAVVPACYLFSRAVRAIPGLRRLFS